VGRGGLEPLTSALCGCSTFIDDGLPNREQRSTSLVFLPHNRVTGWGWLRATSNAP
jgi:hypothetical protein